MLFTRSMRRVMMVLALAVATSWTAQAIAAPSKPTPVECTGGVVKPQDLVTPTALIAGQPDLIISGACQVLASSKAYYYGAVNIVTKGANKGTLQFVEPASGAADQKTEFWASSIIVENGGSMLAGTSAARYGAHGAVLTITLYGADQNNRDPASNKSQGALCYTNVPDPKPPAGSKSPFVPCGIPVDQWDSNGATKFTMPGKDAAGLPIQDVFYTYGPTYGDGAPQADKQIGFFGTKVLAVSYGGTLGLYGYKGATGGDAADADATHTGSGTSWARLALDLKATAAGSTDDPTLTLDRSVKNDWQVDDWIVVTSTDYLASHSEKLQIKSIDSTGKVVTVRTPIKWQHNGTRFNLSRLTSGGTTGPGGRLTAAGMDPNLIRDGAETRAAVGLLTRSIQIVSGGDTAGQTFAQAEAAAGNKHYYYGGHTIFRQGFQQVQVQGVEFRQLGQGGVLGHYPVHFHMARQIPGDTFVKDSSINESMTRWVVIHSTLRLLVARNVGYWSIGHGFYLEDGTETENRFYSNLGVYARAGVSGPDNPLNVPGILARDSGNAGGLAGFPQNSDILNPSAFWIMNGWNEFIGNMAAGTGTCGSCFWLVPGANSDMKDVNPNPMAMQPMTWTGFGSAISGNSAIQANGRYGLSPLSAFYKNYCSTSMNALMTVGDTACDGVAGATDSRANFIKAVRAPALSQMFEPKTTSLRNPTVCDPKAADFASCTQFNTDATGLKQCAKGDPNTCALTVVDHFTTSFNWSPKNFSAIWLRGGWQLMDNSFISDVQNGGVTIVSGGDFTRSSVALGYWGLLSRSVLVGTTQPNNPMASNRGPFNLASKLSCVFQGVACINTALSATFPVDGFSVSQRLLNIYDGPVYEDANAFLDVSPSACTSQPDCMYFGVLGVTKYPTKAVNGAPTFPGSYLPNAAIAWKQPNGFYYPPAFHSTNLYFDKVDIRHFLIDPLFIPSTYRTDFAAVQRDYTGTINNGMFNGYTDIDLQTELSDDDGTLTGLADTVSVSDGPLFSAPTETPECASNLGILPDAVCKNQMPSPPRARTSPYEYVTTILYPGCAVVAHGAPTACGSMHIVEPPPPPPPTGPNRNHYSIEEGRGGTWSAACGSSYCFGVPIYRQYLTGVKGSDTAPVVPFTKEWAQWHAAGCDTKPSPSGKPYADPPVNTTANNLGDAKCQFPFARMNASPSFARSAMTANHGLYYIDTTIPLAVQQASTFAMNGVPNQSANGPVGCAPDGPITAASTDACGPMSVNQFSLGATRAASTYYLFFAFAKNTTKQTYQIYVGSGFDVTKDLEGVRMTISGSDLQPIAMTAAETHNLLGIPGTADGPKMIAGPNDIANQPSVLQVTVDFSKFATELDPERKASGLCRPTGFCGWDSASHCGCTLDPKSPQAIANPALLQVCKKICEVPPAGLTPLTGTIPASSGWATKDTDCPGNNCLGFAFTLSKNFKVGTYQRPQPVPYPTSPDVDAKFWQMVFKNATQVPDSKVGGTCHYASLPGPGQCQGN